MDAEAPRKKSLLFCVSGSIAAATNSVLLLQLLLERQLFEEIVVALSDCALKFVREEPFAVLAKRKCITNIFDDAREGVAVHVVVAQRCDLALIAPASSNLIAKLAHGICDDTITNMLSVFKGQCILAPAAHPTTSRKPSFERNLSQLVADGYLLCGPVSGYSISEGRRGPDVPAMPGPETIAAFVEHMVINGEPPPIEFGYHAFARRLSDSKK